MVAPIETAYVYLWDDLAGAVAWDPDRQLAVFEFDPAFLDKNLDPAPLMMPIAQARRSITRYAFPGLPFNTFRGLPGMLADALPDRFGNQLINAWLARQGRTPDSFTPLERLCYIGRRAMGVLAFEPSLAPAMEESVPVEVADLVGLAQSVINDRSGLRGNLKDSPAASLLEIIRVGTSAGGARAKVVIAMDESTGEVRSGQVEAPPGFDHWILKLDGVADTTLGDPTDYGRIEYAYHLMAVAAGIQMTECRLLEEDRRAHFMTRRFDRPSGGGRLHLQSLCALAHFDYNSPGSCSYEQAFQVMRELRLPYPDAEQLFRRMVFNVVARNQDDHTKNIAFVMDRTGRWRLSPAYDVIYAYNPAGLWTGQHQMSINGKRDDVTTRDLVQVGRQMNIKRHAAIIEQIIQTVSRWPDFADQAGVNTGQVNAIGRTHRLRI